MLLPARISPLPVAESPSAAAFALGGLVPAGGVGGGASAPLPPPEPSVVAGVVAGNGVVVVEVVVVVTIVVAAANVFRCSFKTMLAVLHEETGLYAK